MTHFYCYVHRSGLSKGMHCYTYNRIRDYYPPGAYNDPRAPYNQSDLYDDESDDDEEEEEDDDENWDVVLQYIEDKLGRKLNSNL